MNKSDFLDELRMEIGLAYDYAEDRDDFLKKVIDTLYTCTNKKTVLTVHTCKSGNCRLIYAAGFHELSEKEHRFGHGFLISGTSKNVTCVRKGKEQVLFLPIGEKGIPEYVLTIRLLESNYSFSKQDMIFAEELVHFIERKRAAF